MRSQGMRRRRWQAGSASGLMWAAPASSDEEEDGDDGSNERRMIPQLGDEVPTVGDGALKTLTFVAEALATRNADTQCAACSFDFEVRATNLDGNASVPLVVSLVRVIKIGGGAAGHVIGDADAASGGRGLPFVTKLAVALGVVVAVYALVFGANLLLRRKHIRFSVRSSINPNIASASPDLQAWHRSCTLARKIRTADHRKSIQLQSLQSVFSRRVGTSLSYVSYVLALRHAILASVFRSVQPAYSTLLYSAATNRNQSRKCILQRM